MDGPTNPDPIVVRLGYRTEPPAGDPVRQAAREAEGRRADAALADRFTMLAGELEGREYFCGAFTVADIAMFMAVLWTQRLRGPKWRLTLPWRAGTNGWDRGPAPAKAAAEIAAADRELSRPLAG